MREEEVFPERNEEDRPVSVLRRLQRWCHSSSVVRPKAALRTFLNSQVQINHELVSCHSEVSECR